MHARAEGTPSGRGTVERDLRSTGPDFVVHRDSRHAGPRGRRAAEADAEPLLHVHLRSAGPDSVCIAPPVILVDGAPQT